MSMNEMLVGAVSLFKIIDERILLFINGLHAPFADWWMWWISEKTTWIPLYPILAFLLFRRSSWQRAVLCLFFIVLVIAATDQTCAALIRPLVGRLRPSNTANALSSLLHLVNGYRGGSYGFPSCHAANSFALAVFLSLRFRRTAATVLLLSWAALISYSRIYLGVHYPGDVLCGMAMGGLYAAVGFYGFSRVCRCEWPSLRFRPLDFRPWRMRFPWGSWQRVPLKRRR